MVIPSVRALLAEVVMAREGLFENLPETAAPKADIGGAPRLREPVRNQIELRAMDLDSLIGADHPARAVWAYVERLDLGVLEDQIKAREGRPGHPPATPRLLLALWLFATSQGVGSARALARLCESHDAYRWLCGGVSVNYHTLADFRLAHPALLDDLLTRNVAALAAVGVIDLDTLAQDGVRVRASAGAASFRRRKTLHKCLKRARRLVERLKREIDDDPDASNRRIRAARERAAAEREARVAAALERLAELEAERARRAKTNAEQTKKQGEPRASTTDPEARVMKMADGGFRPAYNMQIVSAVEAQIVVAVDAETSGSDRGRMAPMLTRIKTRYDRAPRRYLADGGFTKNADIEWAADPANGAIQVHCPPIKSRHDTDPFASRADDGPGMAAWRRRMKSAAGKARYKRRAIAECLHARFRHWNLRQLTVRGRAKARTVLLWFALANNILRAQNLLPAPA
jgi:transposase